MTPFMGVRISWLIMARKSSLALLACSANSLACNAVWRMISTDSCCTQAKQAVSKRFKMGSSANNCACENSA